MDRLEASTATLAVLTHSQFALPDEAADTYWLLQRWPLALQDELDAAAERIRGYRGDFQQELLQDQQQLQADLQQLQVRLGAERSPCVRVAQGLTSCCAALQLPGDTPGHTRTLTAAATCCACNAHNPEHGSSPLSVLTDINEISPLCTHPYLQTSITDFTKVGGLQAAEERLIAVQDYEAKLDELDRLAETYRVSVAAQLHGAVVHWLRDTAHAGRSNSSILSL